ncbi:aminotransferase class V-fold PLP-dependent enzyme [Candidatus Bathyarchaeota archaeon]|nr:aminotransferase class V-fold PLP-dependent enzyme [Candidatus Bathyarchaeota archaeon]
MTPESYKLASSPRRFEAGTPAIAEAIGLGASIDYLQKLGMEAIAEHERRIAHAIYRGLSSIKGVRVFGPEDWRLRTGILSFCVGNMNSP